MFLLVGVASVSAVVASSELIVDDMDVVDTEPSDRFIKWDWGIVVVLLVVVGGSGVVVVSVGGSWVVVVVVGLPESLSSSESCALTPKSKFSTSRSAR